MEKYKFYTVADFLGDDLFIDGVLAPDEHSETYWNTVFSLYPTIEADAMEAKRLLLSIRIRPNKTIPRRVRDEIIEHVLARSVQEPVRPEPKRIFRIVSQAKWIAAACVLLFIGLAILMYENPSRPVQTTNDLVYIMPDDKTTEQKVINTSSIPLLLMLPDKSSVVLESSSYIVYDEATFAKNREVRLVGEAFFEVQNQENVPFKVKTDYLTAKVLGTSFRVRAFSHDTGHRVTVNTGLVQVQKTKGDGDVLHEATLEEILYVGANQEAIYDTNTIQLTQTDIPLTAIPEKAPLSKEALETLFDFQSTPLETVLTTLGERYQITIQLDDPVLAGRTITASLSDLHLYEKLDLISKAAEARYYIEDGRIKFTPIEVYH